MKVLVCGDRNWEDKETLYAALDGLEGVDQVIEGGARGADRMGREWAKERGIRVSTIAAEWGKYGKAAGPIRNLAMLLAFPDLVMAFHDDIENSKGTKHMIQAAEKKGVPVTLTRGNRLER